MDEAVPVETREVASKMRSLLETWWGATGVRPRGALQVSGQTVGFEVFDDEGTIYTVEVRLGEAQCASEERPGRRCQKPSGHKGEHVDEHNQGWIRITPSPEMRAVVLAAAGLEDELDLASSASRQHYIDTGEYLRKGEALES